MFETWFLLAIFAALMYGTGQTVLKSVLGNISVARMIVINFIVSMPIYIFFLTSSTLILDIGQYGLIAIFIGIAAAFLGRAGYYTYMEALESGPVTIVGSITAAYPAIIAILAITILGETITMTQGIGIAIVIAGIVALSYSRRGSEADKSFTDRSKFFCVVTLALWGVWGLFVKIALDAMPTILYLGLYTFALPTVLFGYLGMKRIKIRDNLPMWSVPVIIAIISVMIAQIGICADSTAVSLGPASIVFPLVAAYPIITIVEAQFFLKERLKIREMLIVLLVVLGIILVSTV
ncbi:MAG: DMT family transporter [Thermoplasmata archaeon]|nr:DMT family transporter [Thermoplasmata archaeon]